MKTNLTVSALLSARDPTPVIVSGAAALARRSADGLRVAVESSRVPCGCEVTCPVSGLDLAWVAATLAVEMDDGALVRLIDSVAGVHSGNVVLG